MKYFLIILLTLNCYADKINFAKDIWPILENKCLKCHGPDKIEKGKIKHAKGGLRIDHVKALLLGGDNGPVIKAGESSKSPFYTLTDPDHDDVMPPKGKPLTTDQRKAIKTWIDEGANFGAWTKHTVEMSQDIKTLVSKMRKHGATLVPAWETSDKLMVNLMRMEKVSDETLEMLAPAHELIIDLGLTNLPITDAGMKVISKMSYLEKLNLTGTKVTDAGVKNLTNLPKLEYLILFGTEISDESLAVLGKLPSLKKLFISNTKFTEKGVEALKEMNKELYVDFFIPKDVPVPEQAAISPKANNLKVKGIFPLKGKPGVLKFDFESGDLQGWKVVSGNLGQPVSAKADFRNRRSSMNKEGKFYLNSLETNSSGGWSDGQTGIIESPVFELKSAEMTMLIGGGQGKGTYIALCTLDGKEQLKSHGRNDELFFLNKWSAKHLVGKKVFLKLVDTSRGGWGHILFDAFETIGTVDKAATAKRFNN